MQTQSTRSIIAPLVAIILGTFMVILDNTVVNVALPHARPRVRIPT